MPRSIMLFSDDSDLLWKWKAALVKRLLRFRLTIHPGSHPRPVTEGIPFLGFVVYPDRRRLKRRKGVAYTRKFRREIVSYNDGLIEIDRLQASFAGWANHVRFGNTVGLKKALLAEFRSCLNRGEG
jgi:hypothetical protein